MYFYKEINDVVLLLFVKQLESQKILDVKDKLIKNVLIE